jgi:serine phosphatase RsbU (regulator of sigma subunit)
LKGTKAGIGGSTPDTQEFALRTLTLEAGDNLYLFTDGYPDQFSESSRRKITTRRLREMLEENHALTMAEKGVRLNQFFLEWKGGFMQLDDVLVVGVGV